MNLSKSLLWDVNPKDIDWQKNARFIIARVLTRGIMQDWKEIIAFYGLDKIKQEALQIRYLDKITLNFCSTLFNIPISKFRCYKQQQSIKAPWNY